MYSNRELAVFRGGGKSRCRKLRALLSGVHRRMNNHRPQSGKTYSAKPCRIAFALFLRLKYPVSDDLADTVTMARSAELGTMPVRVLARALSPPNL